MADTLFTQLAANIYLQNAPEGGELEIWKLKLSDEQYDSFRLNGSYGLDRKMLSKPDIVIRPNIGDLILFNSVNVHAVRSTKRGSRVTLSCFIGYRGIDEPLTYWS